MPHIHHSTGFAPRVNYAPAMSTLQVRFEAAQRIAAQAAGLAMRMRPPAGAAQATLKGAQDWLTKASSFGASNIRLWLIHLLVCSH